MMTEFLHLIQTEKWVFSVFFCLIYFLFGFLLLTTVSNHLIMREVIAWNKQLGFGMTCEFGWLGVRIIPIPVSGKGIPDRVSTEGAEKTKIEMNGRCLWNFFFLVRRVGALVLNCFGS